MFDKITNYLDAASNNIKVASAKMQRHSEEMVIRAEDSFFEEFGVSYEDHKAAQAQDKAILRAEAKYAKTLPKLKAQAEKEAYKAYAKFHAEDVKARVKAKPSWQSGHRMNNPYDFDFNELT